MCETNQEWPRRVMLWGSPRCMTTAFYRAMTNHPDVKTLFEPYLPAYYLGEERMSNRYKDTPIQKNSTFMDSKKACEEQFPEAKVVFAKDMAYFLRGRMDSAEYLPKGFTHTFMIRDPRKSIVSLYNLMNKKTSKEWEDFEKCEAGCKELYGLVQIVTKQLGHEPIIIDADDMLENPEGIMRLYCQQTGIAYHDKLINWDHPPDIELYGGEIYRVWFSSLLSTSGFAKHVSKPISEETLRSLPQDVTDAIEENLPYYFKLHTLRLQSK